MPSVVCKAFSRERGIVHDQSVRAGRGRREVNPEGVRSDGEIFTVRVAKKSRRSHTDGASAAPFRGKLMRRTESRNAA
jgi:hypothetical protein